jgi:16S rRNA C1402 (ribose-2'-O) methylase RsmI
MTERAVATLRQVAHVAAEDTRRTRGLLSHFGITARSCTRSTPTPPRARSRVW